MRRYYDAIMSRLHGPLNSLWALVVSVILGVLIGVLGNYVYDELAEPKGSSLNLSLTELLRPSSLGIIVGFVALTLLSLWLLRFLARRGNRRHKARERFELLESANKLRPEDFGFRVIGLEETASPDLRPFYETVYVPRKAVPYDKRASEDPQPRYDEAELSKLLKNGGSFVLLGPPLDGKSRTLYEIVRGLDNCEVVVPRPNEREPEEEVFDLLFEKKRVLVLLDDLTRYVDPELDLREFWQRLGRRASFRAIAATCRDGSELDAVRNTLQQGLRWFYDRIPLELSLVEASAEEKRLLAVQIHKVENESYWAEFRELGYIVMDNPMMQMRRRFQRLSHDNPEQRNALWALKLLSDAGVLPFTQERLMAVMQSVFGRSPAYPEDCLNGLAEQSFIRPGSYDPVEPERAYLRDDVVTFFPGKTFRDYLSKLGDVLEELEDIPGLFHLGTTYGLTLGEYKEACACFNRAVRLRPNDPSTLLDKAKALSNLANNHLNSGAPEEAAKTAEEALRVSEDAIQLRPGFADAWHRKGRLLEGLERPQEALDALDTAIDLNPELHDAWCKKGVALMKLGRFAEAIDVIDEAVRLDPTCVAARMNKGITLCEVAGLKPGSDRYSGDPELLEQVVKEFQEGTTLRPDNSKTWMHLCIPLYALKRYQEVFDAIDKATTLSPKDAVVWQHRSVALGALDRHEEAEEAADEALLLKPDFTEAWLNKAQAQYHLGKPWVEVAQSHDRAIALRPNDPIVWYAKASNAQNMRWYDDALNNYDKAIELHPNFADAWAGKGIALLNLKEYQQALGALDRATSLAPDLKEAGDRKGIVLRALGRHEEAQEAFDRATSIRLPTNKA
jgi:tetratricopeptide (TPR) repeat protein